MNAPDSETGQLEPPPRAEEATDLKKQFWLAVASLAISAVGTIVAAAAWLSPTPPGQAEPTELLRQLKTIFPYIVWSVTGVAVALFVAQLIIRAFRRRRITRQGKAVAHALNALRQAYREALDQSNLNPHVKS